MPTVLRRFRFMLVALLTFASLGISSASADVREGYAFPTLVAPYATKKPVIDGTINDKEWEGASSVNAMLTTSRTLSARATRFWVCWDEDNLYIAMRSPLRKGERVVQALRDQSKDINVVFDDSYEIWLDANSRSRDGQPVVFQFLCNFAGARYDVMHEPAVGNSRLGWNGGWKPMNRIAPPVADDPNSGGAWEMEVAIPRTSIFIDRPFNNGSEVRLLIARNFKRPWEQNSFVGSSSFSARETYAKLVLRKDVPAIHLINVADPATKTLGVELAAAVTRSMKIQWSFVSDTGVSKNGTIDAEPDKLAHTPSGINLDPLAPEGKPSTDGKGSFRVRATIDDGKTVLLDWAANRQFGDLAALKTALNDDGKQVGVELILNPVRDYLRVTGDFIGYDARGDIKDVALTVTDSAGKKLAEKHLKLDALNYVRDTVALPGLVFGEYTAKLACFDAAGKTIVERESKFTKKNNAEFPWWKTKVGDIEKVISPWTPVVIAPAPPEHTAASRVVKVWGRETRVGDAGLPASVASQGRELLAGPVRLEIVKDKKAVAVTKQSLADVSSQPHRAALRVGAEAGDLALSSTITAEFDGMYKMEVTLTPRGRTAVDSIRLVVPVKPEVAQLLHASGQGIRYGFDVVPITKDGKGRLWDSRRVDGQNMAVGSFIPFVWVGDHRGGISWYADSDQGWIPSDETPAIELRRDGKGSVDLVFNLVNAPATLDAPRTITFAFQATPVKAMHRGWRMDSWWTGDTFRDYQGVTKKGGDLIWTNIPFTLDAEACKSLVEAQHKSNNSYNFGLPRFKASAVPYLEWNHIAAQFAPEASYFAEEWKAMGAEGGLIFEDTLSDYVVYHLGTWSKATGIDGIYIDNSRPVTCDNLDAGRGYRLPDGRVQPTFQIFSTRKLMLRIRAAFAEQGKSGKFVLHMTNNMVIPWVGAADIAYDGEHNVIYPDSGVDFMDAWSLDRLRLDVSEQWGVAINFMNEFQGPWDDKKVKKAMRGYTGMVLLHDGLPSGNGGNRNTECWIGRDRFGVDADDTSFLFYLDPNTGVKCATKDVYASAWKRDEKLLLVVVNSNRAETDATIELDVKKLGLPALQDAKIWDAETLEAIPGGKSGKFTVKLPPRDYRQIIVEKK